MNPGDELVTDPAYVQLSHRLLDLIQSENYRVGDRFFTERQVSERFGVSRTTANKALSNLVSAGHLELRRGVGTFVASQLLKHELHHLNSFTEKAKSLGLTPTTEVIDFQRLSLRSGNLPAPVQETLRLRDDDDSPVFYMKRLRLAEGTPLILEDRYLIGRHCADIKSEDLNGSLYRLLSERYELRIGSVDQTIRAINLNHDEARLLDLAVGGAALEVTAIATLHGGEPLWSERTLFRADRYEFRNVIEDGSPTSPAEGVIRNSGVDNE